MARDGQPFNLPPSKAVRGPVAEVAFFVEATVKNFQAIREVSMDPKISSDSDHASSQGEAHDTQSAGSEIQDSTATAAIPLVRGAGGPRTPKGKERSRQNAFTHGLFSRAILLKGESREKLDYLRNELYNDRQPVGMLEIIQVEMLTASLWRYRRFLSIEGPLLKQTWNSFLSGMQSDGKQMELLLRCGTSLGREYDRILKQLERLQAARLGQPVAPSIDVNINTD